MRKLEKIFYCILISLIIFSCNTKQNLPAIEIKKLDYPSASAIEYYNGKLYIMGDDAADLLILDTNFNIINTVPILLYHEKRIPKNIKPDIESSAIYSANNEAKIFLLGSGSLDPYRNSGWRYNIVFSEKDSFNLEPLYLNIKKKAIDQINIEGACFVSRKLILVNRGNKSYPQNHLIITDENFWMNDSSLQILIIPFAAQKDTASFKGISGLCYAKESDKLIMTVSTEDTRSVHEDGAIGKSYLWIINDISTKLNNKTINRNRVIDLEYIDSRFKGQKIESAVVIKETNKLIYLVLVADNDDGSSTIFKMAIEKTKTLGE